MTLSLKGFILNAELKNNTPGAIARFGELSTHCRTFSKDVQEISNPGIPSISVAVFSHHNVANKIQVAVSHVYADLVLEMSAWLHASSVAFTATTTQLDVVAAFVNRFEANVSNVTVGPMVGIAGRYMPTRLQTTITMQGMEELSLTLWTTNAEFETGYDEYEIVIVPPLDNIDVFMGAYSAVHDQMTIVNPVRDLTRIESALAKKPATHTVASAINWVDPTQPTRKVPTTWYALIYGSRGNTSDAINEALRAYILANSTSAESNWRIVMPDLFRVTRFLMIPLWASIAIAGRTSIAGIYSPVASSTAITEAIQTISADIGINKANYEVFNHPFRSLSLVVLSGDDNREDALRLGMAVPDYIASESTHEDFNRQALATQEFSNLIGTLIRTAENYTSGSALESGLRVIVFDGYTCLAGKYDSIEYIIRTKKQEV